MNYAKVRKIAERKKKILNTKGLGFFKKSLLEKHLWSYGYKSVARAVFIGVFWMMIPSPIQTITAVASGVYFRANIIVTLVVVWISNPLTWVPMYYANYKVGCYLLGTNSSAPQDWVEYAEYMLNHIGEFWAPLYLGSLVGGVVIGFILFAFIMLFGSFKNSRK